MTNVPLSADQIRAQRRHQYRLFLIEDTKRLVDQLETPTQNETRLVLVLYRILDLLRTYEGTSESANND